MTVAYVEERGIWHVVERADGGVITACELRLPDAQTYPLELEPKPLCWRCREATRA